jgi:hypothetical protein
MSVPAADADLWYVLPCAMGAPDENMAFDEALLEWVSRWGRPVLRFYGWSQPAATFGYFQQYNDVATLTGQRPLLRRPTGGGLVPHDADWTYSVAIPPENPWYQFKAVESYRRIHEWLQASFERLSIKTRLSPARVVAAPGQCFVGAEEYDLLFEEQKIAGAAQRRRRDGLLIQGSIQPRALTQSGLRVTRAAWETCVQMAATERWNITWATMPLPDEFLGRVRELMESKYSRDDYHRHRMAVRAEAR